MQTSWLYLLRVQKKTQPVKSSFRKERFKQYIIKTRLVVAEKSNKKMENTWKWSHDTVYHRGVKKNI